MVVKICTKFALFYGVHYLMLSLLTENCTFLKCELFSFFFNHQLITAYEKAMVLIETVPGEEHRKLSADYVKALSKVSASPHISF